MQSNCPPGKTRELKVVNELITKTPHRLGEEFSFFRLKSGILIVTIVANYFDYIYNYLTGNCM